MIIIEKLKSIEDYKKMSIVIPHSKHYLSTAFFIQSYTIFTAVEIILCI